MSKAEYRCPRCGIIGEANTDLNPNFECTICKFIQNTVLLRLEMLDLDDPVEGELAMRIIAGCLKT